MYRGQKARVRGPDSNRLEVEYIGRGTFATAYRDADGSVLLYVKDTDFMKEAIAGIKAPHVPQVEMLSDDVLHGRDRVYVYRMPYYSPLTAASTAAWADYKELARALEAARMYYRQRGRTSAYDGCYIMEHVYNHAKVRRPLKAALRLLIDEAINYGSTVTFEFSPRNLGVDSRGRLILRDVLFDALVIEEQRKAQIRRRTYSHAY